MIGPTGCGKTEIARRLAKLANAPFVKVEATKFTEVGYVGRDVDSIVKDLVEVAVKMTRDEEIAKVRERAADAAEERVLDALLPAPQDDGILDRRRSQPARPGDPAEIPQDAARRAAGRSRDRNRPARDSRRRADHGAARHGGNAGAALEHVRESRRQPHQAAQAQGEGSAEAAGRRGSRQARQRRRAARQGARERRAERHRVHRRDRQGRAPPGNHGRRRVARRRAARPAAAGRRQHRVHEVRADQDRSHPVHRLGRVPHVEAFGSDSGAAGPLPDPRRARVR